MIFDHFHRFYGAKQFTKSCLTKTRLRLCEQAYPNGLVISLCCLVIYKKEKEKKKLHGGTNKTYFSKFKQ